MIIAVEKAKYTRRWKGKDGKWRYDYGSPEQRRGSAPPKASMEGISSEPEGESAVIDAIQKVFAEDPTATIIPALFSRLYGRVATSKAFKTAKAHHMIEVAYTTEEGRPVYRKRSSKKSTEEGSMAKHMLVIFPGDIAPLDKATGHPAGTSKVTAPLDTNNPSVSHRERIKFARMAAKRMLGASAPEDEGEHADNSVVDHKGREAGQKKPHKNYRTNVSGMDSQSSSNFGRRTIVVKPSELGSSVPESANAHQPKVVRKPKA